MTRSRFALQTALYAHVLKKGTVTRKKDPAERTFEETLQRLEEIVESLERGDVALEESLRLYEEGIALSRICAEKLKQAELSIQKLGKDMEGNLRLFGEEGEEE